MKHNKILSFIFFFTFISFVYAQLPAPTNLTAVYKGGNITPGTLMGFVELKWQYPVTNNVMFKVWRKVLPAGEWTNIKSELRMPYYQDMNITGPNIYEYYVVAYNTTGTSPESNHATVIVPELPDRVQFTSEPVRTATINTLYTYDADAVSNNPDAVIKFFLAQGPESMTVDSITGIVNWTPTSAGYYSVQLIAKSNKGGIAHQGYSINVSGPKGTIAGTVTDDLTSLPLPKVSVCFIGTTANRAECVMTDSLGNYSKTLNPGVYKIKFSKNGYITEFFDNKTSLETADPVTVVENTTVTANAGLAKTPPPVIYELGGTVLNVSNEPVKCQMYAYRTEDGPNPTPCPSVVGEKMMVITDSLGNYKFRLLGGKKYIVFANPFNHDYYPEYWDNKRSYLEADKILLNENKNNINFIMDLKPVYANGFSGQVKHFTTGDGVPAFVTAYKLTNNGFRTAKSVRSDSLGNYLIQNVEPGKYILYAMPKLPYLPGYYKLNGVARRWREADTVEVTESGIIENLIINLKARTDTGFAIASGIVKSNSDVGVSAGVIYAVNTNGDVVSYAILNDDGSYSMQDVPAGTYSFEVDKVDYTEGTVNGIFFDYGSNSSKQINLSINPITPTSVGSISTPTKFDLAQNYPNPFNPKTSIRFSLTEKNFVTLKVYNVLGKEVATLISGVKDQGTYDVEFDASNLSSGVYLYKLTSGKSELTKKMILMK